ncbi:hypothetical protein GGI18_006373, partial [Coemansia linderi]
MASLAVAVTVGIKDRVINAATQPTRNLTNPCSNVDSDETEHSVQGWHHLLVNVVLAVDPELGSLEQLVWPHNLVDKPRISPTTDNN